MVQLDTTNKQNSAYCDQALRSIGRNVVLFQKMEKALKALIVASDLRGQASDLAETYRRRRKSIDRRTMGQLIDEFLTAVYADEPPIDASSNGMWMAAGFRVKASEDWVRAWGEALSRIVDERNSLIHDMVATFDLESDESCQKLIVFLDEQHDRLKPHFEYVMAMLGTLHSMQQKLRELVEAEILRSEGPGGNST